MITESIDYLYANTYKNIERAGRSEVRFTPSEYEVISILNQYGYDEEKLCMCADKDKLKDFADSGMDNEKLAEEYKRLLYGKKKDNEANGRIYTEAVEYLSDTAKSEMAYRVMIYKQKNHSEYWNVGQINSQWKLKKSNMVKKNYDFKDNIIASEFGSIAGIDVLRYDSFKWEKKEEVGTWQENSAGIYACLILAYLYIINDVIDDDVESLYEEVKKLQSEIYEYEVENEEVEEIESERKNIARNKKMNLYEKKKQIRQIKNQLFERIPAYSGFWTIVEHAYNAVSEPCWEINQEQWVLFLYTIITGKDYLKIDGDIFCDQAEISETEEKYSHLDEDAIFVLSIKIHKALKHIKLKKVAEKSIIENDLARNKVVGRKSEIVFKDYLAVTVAFWRMTITRNPFIIPQNILKKKIGIDEIVGFELAADSDWKEYVEENKGAIDMCLSNVALCMAYKNYAAGIDAGKVADSYEKMIESYFEFMESLYQKYKFKKKHEKAIQYYLFEQLYAPWYLQHVCGNIKCFMEKLHINDLEQIKKLFEILARIAVMPYARYRIYVAERVLKDWWIEECIKQGGDNTDIVARKVLKKVIRYEKNYVDYEAGKITDFICNTVEDGNYVNEVENDEMYKWYTNEYDRRKKRWSCQEGKVFQCNQKDMLDERIHEKLLAEFVKKRLINNLFQ